MRIDSVRRAEAGDAMTFWEIVFAWFAWNIIAPALFFVLLMAILIAVCVWSDRKANKP